MEQLPEWDPYSQPLTPEQEYAVSHILPPGWPPAQHYAPAHLSPSGTGEVKVGQSNRIGPTREGLMNPLSLRLKALIAIVGLILFLLGGVGGWFLHPQSASSSSNSSLRTCPAFPPPDVYQPASTPESTPFQIEGTMMPGFGPVPTPDPTVTPASNSSWPHP